MQLSIVVPIYNTEKYLRQCLDSIQCQTFKDFEVVLIDDGSTDGSAKICDEYVRMDSRFKVTHKDNEGALLAKLSGINKAKGDFIGFIDSDDWIKSNMYAELVQSAIDSNADICIGGVIRVENGSFNSQISLMQKKFVCSPNEALTYIYKIDCGWILVNKIYRRKLFKGFNSINNNNSYGEDAEMNWYLFNRANKICYIPLMAYYWRIHEESMTHKAFSMERMCYIDRLIKILHEIGKNQTALKPIISKLILLPCTNYILQMVNEKNGYKNEFEKYQQIIKNLYSSVQKQITKRERRKYALATLSYKTILKYKTKQRIKIYTECEKFNKKYKYVYIYGAGVIGKKVAEVLDLKNIEYSGFVVTKTNSRRTFCTKNVLSYLEVKNKYKQEECGLILALSKKNANEVINMLENENKFQYINIGRYSINY